METVDCHRNQNIEVLIDHTEARRHYADNFARKYIHLENASDNFRITSETALPVAVAQHDCFSAAWILIGLRKQAAACKGGTLKHFRIRRLLARCGPLRAARHRSHYRRAPYPQRLKGLVVIGKREIHRWRELKTVRKACQPAGTRGIQPERDESIRFRVGQGTQQHTVDHAEDRRVRTDSECQCMRTMIAVKPGFLRNCRRP